MLRSSAQILVQSKIKVLEKVGFEREGYFRKGIYKEDQFIDQVLYAKVV